MFVMSEITPFFSQPHSFTLPSLRPTTCPALPWALGNPVVDQTDPGGGHRNQSGRPPGRLQRPAVLRASQERLWEPGPGPCWEPSTGAGPRGVRKRETALALRKCGRQLRAAPAPCSVTSGGTALQA